MLKRQYPGSVVPLAMFDCGLKEDHDNVYDCYDKVQDYQAGAFRQGHHHDNVHCFVHDDPKYFSALFDEYCVVTKVSVIMEGHLS